MGKIRVRWNEKNQIFKYIKLLLFFGVLYSPFLKSQNLVPNHSFEEYIDLPCDYTSHIDGNISRYTKHWYMPTRGSADIHSTLIDENCHLKLPFSENLYGNGYQYPKSGNFTLGISTYSFIPNRSLDYREYAQVKLKKNLIPGEKYIGGFWVSLTDSSSYSINNLGIHFSMHPVTTDTFIVLDVNPQVNEKKILSETNDWVLVKGEFVADQPYEYITIGNFYSDSHTQIMDMGKGRHPYAFGNNAYYYIDDVFVEPYPELNIPNVFTPNGDQYNETFYIEGLEPGIWTLEIFNRWGKKIYHNDAYDNDWSITRQSTGVFYYHLSRHELGLHYRGYVTVLDN